MKNNLAKRIATVMFVVYLMLLFYILFLYGERVGNQFHLEVFAKEHLDMVNFIPFATVISFWKMIRNDSINTDIVVRNIIANLLMFMPMGMFGQILFREKFNKWWKNSMFVAGVVLLLEIIQFFTFCGCADIDDIILNTVGATVGYGTIQLIRRYIDF